jgi:hypothetical protein
MKPKDYCECGGSKDLRAKYCKLCYNKKRKENSPFNKICSICGESIVAKGRMCRKCWRKVDRNMDSANPHYSGENVGYHGIHSWVRRRKEKSAFCEQCKKEKPNDLANISGGYKRNLDDYKWLCRKCHMISDGRLDKFITMAKCSKKKECKP